MCWESAVLLDFRMCCLLCVVLIVNVPFPFGVWGRMWNSIVLVPNHCLFVYYLKYCKFKFQTVLFPPSLIRVFAIRMKNPGVLRYPTNAQRRLRSDWADAQADLSLCWAHSHIVGFVMSRLKYSRSARKNIKANYRCYRKCEPLPQMRTDCNHGDLEYTPTIQARTWWSAHISHCCFRYLNAKQNTETKLLVR